MAVELNPWTMQAVRNIKAGDTPYQRRRDFERRAIVGGVQAGLIGLGGAISASMDEKPEQPQPADNGVKSYEERLNAAKKEVMARAIQNANASTYGENPGAGPLHGQSFVPEAAKAVQNSVAAAEKGVGVSYGDYWNRRAFDEASQQADLLTHDMQVAKELMSQGDRITKDRPQPTGIGGSMRTWGQ